MTLISIKRRLWDDDFGNAGNKHGVGDVWHLTGSSIIFHTLQEGELCPLTHGQIIHLPWRINSNSIQSSSDASSTPAMTMACPMKHLQTLILLPPSLGRRKYSKHTKHVHVCILLQIRCSPYPISILL